MDQEHIPAFSESLTQSIIRAVSCPSDEYSEIPLYSFRKSDFRDQSCFAKSAFPPARLPLTIRFFFGEYLEIAGRGISPDECLHPYPPLFRTVVDYCLPY